MNVNFETYNNSDILLIEGSNESIQIDILDILGEPYADIAIARVEWKMSRYGETECIISRSSDLDNILIDNNIIIINLASSDTENLFGKFSHQVTITDVRSKKFIADLGKITIKPSIK